MTSQSATKKTERQEAIAKLREWIKPGDVITTVLRHVSRSGMQRSISMMVPLDGEVFALDYYAARASERKIDRDNGGVKIGGAGMDMGFALVYDLARDLWPNGYGCVGEKCRSNDHSNGDRDRTPHAKCRTCRLDFRELSGGAVGCPMHGIVSAEVNDNGEVGAMHWHSDGGYALQQRWL